MKDVKIVFFGTHNFSKGILESLIINQYNVIGVVSQPDKPVGRKHEIKPTPVKELALKHNIPLYQPVKLRTESSMIVDLKPDLIITCAYGQMIPEDILKAPQYGCLNIHPSLLPKYRGGAPIQRAIWNGDEKTGVCLMEMVKAMDAGKVFARVDYPIHPDITSSELFDELEVVSKKLLIDNLPLYLDGKLPGVEQDESGVVIARNIAKEEEQVIFAKENLHEAYNHIRALIEAPIAYGVIDGKRMKFYKARIEEKETTSPSGTVLSFNNGAMQISCDGGILNIYELQLEGKSKMNASDFANGAGRSLIGKRFA